MARWNWNEDEITLALKIYFELRGRNISVRKFDSGMPEITNLAALLSINEYGTVRKPGSVQKKLLNLARFDPTAESCLPNGSKLDEVVWNRFHGNPEALDCEYRRIMEEHSKRLGTIGDGSIDESDILPTTESEAMIIRRRHQEEFRRNVLGNYGNKCCITGIDIEDFLIASHIKPWAKSSDRERLDTANGLCLNGLHDRAFDKGYITLDSDYTLVLSPVLQESMPKKQFDTYFKKFEGKEISPPEKEYPDEKYLQYHRNKIFREKVAP